MLFDDNSLLLFYLIYMSSRLETPMIYSIYLLLFIINYIY